MITFIHENVGWVSLLAFAGLVVIHVSTWHVEQARSSSEKRFSLQLLNTSSIGGIAAVSILIPASFLIIQMSVDPCNLDSQNTEFIRIAVNWFLASLLFGIFFIFLIPMKIVSDPLEKKDLGFCFGAQLICLGIGMGNLVIGTYYIWE